MTLDVHVILDNHICACAALYIEFFKAPVSLFTQHISSYIQEREEDEARPTSLF